MKIKINYLFDNCIFLTKKINFEKITIHKLYKKIPKNLFLVLKKNEKITMVLRKEELNEFKEEMKKKWEKDGKPSFDVILKKKTLETIKLENLHLKKEEIKNKKKRKKKRKEKRKRKREIEDSKKQEEECNRKIQRKKKTTQLPKQIPVPILNKTNKTNNDNKIINENFIKE